MKERPIIMGAESVLAILAGTKTQTRRVITPQPPPADPAQPYSLDPRVALAVGSYNLNDYDALPKEPGVVTTFGAVGYVRDRCGQTEWRCPYGVPGDRLWVKEAWAIQGFTGIGRGGAPFAPPAACHPDTLVEGTICYRADQRAEGFDHERGLPLTIAAGRVAGTAAWRSPLFMPRWASRLTLAITAIRAEPLQSIGEEDARAEGMVPEPDDVFNRPWQRSALLPFREHWNALNAKRGYPWASNPFVWVVEFARIGGA